MTATIEVANLTKRYGPVEAVRDLSFVLEPGEIIGSSATMEPARRRS